MRHLGPECLANGAGSLIDGKLICLACQIVSAKEPKKLEQSRFPAGYLAIPAALLLVTGIILPAQVFFFGAMASLLVLLIGALGFTINARIRLVLLCAGVFGLAGCVYGIVFVTEGGELRAQLKVLAEDATQIAALLKDDRAGEAEVLLKSMEVQATTKKGAFISPEAQRYVLQSRQAVEDWYGKTFGAADVESRKILEYLLSLYPPKLNGALRFRGIQCSGKTIELTGLFEGTRNTAAPREGEMALPFDESVYINAANLCLSILRNSSGMETVQIQILVLNDGAEQPAGTLTIARTNFDGATPHLLIQQLNPYIKRP